MAWIIICHSLRYYGKIADITIALSLSSFRLTAVTSSDRSARLTAHVQLAAWVGVPKDLLLRRLDTALFRVTVMAVYAPGG